MIVATGASPLRTCVSPRMLRKLVPIPCDVASVTFDVRATKSSTRLMPASWTPCAENAVTA